MYVGPHVPSGRQCLASTAWRVGFSQGPPNAFMVFNGSMTVFQTEGLGSNPSGRSKLEGLMLSDKLQNAKSPPRRKANERVRRWYSDAQKIEAVKLWLVTGNLVVTAATLNIPLPTLKEWRYTKWWDEIVSEIRVEGTLQLSNKLKAVAEKAIGVTLDRLDNGDWIMNQKTGVLERKPVAMRDAYQVAAGLLDRHMELDRKPQEEAQNQKTQDRLEALAKAFEKFAGKIPKNEVIDVEFKDAIPEEASRQSGQEEPSREGELHEPDQRGAVSLQEGSESEELPEESWSSETQETDAGNARFLLSKQIESESDKGKESPVS